MSGNGSSKKTWLATVAVVGTVTIVVAGLGTQAYLTERGLSHTPVVTSEVMSMPLPASPKPGANNSELAASLRAIAADSVLGDFAGAVIDIDAPKDSTEVWSLHPDKKLQPASTTKLLTAAAALYTFPLSDRIATEVMHDPDGTLTLRAAGDVMLTDHQLDDLAGQIVSSGVNATQLCIDTRVWRGEPFSPDWDKDDIAGGYIAPITPIMLYGGRQGGTTGDLPRSTTPAEDVGKALAQRLRVQYAGEQPTEDRVAVATVFSDPLIVRLQEMMEQSDNVVAEATGRQIAVNTGNDGSQAGARKAILDVLAQHGIPTDGIHLVDSSGLSTDNAISPATFATVLAKATHDEKLRPLLDTLPVAGGEGTLDHRFEGTPGQGWVRAKTGTLRTTASLAGVVTAANGHTYVFAFMCNDAEVGAARAAMDTMATTIREYARA